MRSSQLAKSSSKNKYNSMRRRKSKPSRSQSRNSVTGSGYFDVDDAGLSSPSHSRSSSGGKGHSRSASGVSAQELQWLVMLLSPMFKEELSQVERRLAKVHFIDSLSRSLKLTRVQAAAALATAIGAVVFLMSGGNALSNLIGFVYPLYASFKAVRSVEKDDDTHWLTYWVVYGSFTVVQSFFQGIVSKIPFFQIFKSLFLMWCFLPKYNGAEKIYRYVIYRITLWLKFHDDRGSMRRVSSFLHKMVDDEVPENQEELYGVLRITVHSARGLEDIQKIGIQDPYVQLRLGDVVHRSRADRDGHVNPKWNETFDFQIDPDETTKITIKVRNENHVADDSIDRLELDVYDLLRNKQSRRWHPLNRKGELELAAHYVAPIKISILEARKLDDVQTVGKQDPFAQLELMGSWFNPTHALRTPTSQDTVHEAKWNHDCFINYNFDEAHDDEPSHVVLSVFNHNTTVNDLIGDVRITLDQLDAWQHTGPRWVSIERDMRKSGEVRINIA